MNPQDITLLIVDDEDTLREALVFDFEMKKFKVLAAPNGKEAFELIKNNKIDVVITDVRMPGGDGIELLTKTRQYNLAIPIIIFITGFADMTTDEAYERGSAAVFSKPFDRKALFESVVKAVTAREVLWSRMPEATAKADFQCEAEIASWETFREAKPRSFNMGRNGFFFKLQDKFPRVGNLVRFKITSKSGDPGEVSGVGTVRWIRTTTNGDLQAGCGVEIEFIDPAGRAALSSQVNQVNPIQYIPRA